MWVVNFIVLFFLIIFVASCNYEPNEIIYTNATINVLDKDVSRVSISSCETKITVSGSVVFVDLMFPNLCSESDYLISLEYFDGVIVENNLGYIVGGIASTHIIEINDRNIKLKETTIKDI